MPIPPDGPQKSFTAEEVDAWLLATAERHAAIHLKAAQPWQSQHPTKPFADMSILLLEAFEEVCVVSEQLREDSQATRSQSRTLRAHCAHLLEQSTATMKRLAQFMSPSPEAIRQAESQILEIFKNGPAHKDESSNKVGR